jgi:lipopolysaccharide export system permease protein
MKAAKLPAAMISEIEVEYHKKYSLSFACLIMMLIGAPLGLMSGRSGMGASAFMGIIIFTVYWVFLISGEDLADKGNLSPFLSMWNANIVAGIVALFLIYKTGRGSKVSFEFISAAINKIKKMFQNTKNRQAS